MWLFACKRSGLSKLVSIWRQVVTERFRYTNKMEMMSMKKTLNTSEKVTADSRKGHQAIAIFRAQYNKAGLTEESAQTLNEHPGFAKYLAEGIRRFSVKAPDSIVSEQVEKFALLVDLGIITVPEDYVHTSRLTTFREKYRTRFNGFNDKITDKNFQNPTQILKPGDKFHVRIFEQVVEGTSTSEERMAFLATLHAIHTGAQGASLVFEKRWFYLPKVRWYVSFDEKDRLLEDAGGYHMVPSVYCGSDSFDFDLWGFRSFWYKGPAFFCFTEATE